LAADSTRLGRPPKLDDAGTDTRERLLAAAAAACIEHGFENATVADIARRAEVSAPAIYNHFGGKVELMIAAGRWALEQLRPERGRTSTPQRVARAFIADDFADSRILLTELHLASHRHRELGDLLATWHQDRAAEWLSRSPAADPVAVVKLFFALLLGLCQIDALSALATPMSSVTDRLDALLQVLFPEEPSS
jgi:AcrR family transcriptional regulator